MFSPVISWSSKWLCNPWHSGLIVRASTRDPKTRGSNPVWSTRQICVSFSESKCCADSLSVCPTPVCIRTHKNDHVRTLKILQSTSEFGGLQKHENTARRKKTTGYKRRTMAARFPRGKVPKFPMHCIETRKLSNLIFCQSGSHIYHWNTL